MKLKSLYIVMFASLLMVSGCSTLLPTGKPYQENLLSLCPTTLPNLTNPDQATSKEVLLVWSEAGSMYHDCRIRHNGLVEAVRARQDPDGTSGWLP